MATGDIYQVTVGSKLDGQAIRNVLHFKAKTDAANGEDLEENVYDCLAEALAAALSSGWTGDFISVKKVYPTVGVDEVWNIPEVVGEQGASEPTYVAAVLSHYTNSPGKEGRGRTYIAGIPQAYAVDSELAAGALTALAAFVTCMVGKFVSGSAPFDWGVVSRKNKAATPTVPANWFHNIIGVGIDSVLGTQRSRKIRRGI